MKPIITDSWRHDVVIILVFIFMLLAFMAIAAPEEVIRIFEDGSWSIGVEFPYLAHGCLPWDEVCMKR